MFSTEEVKNRFVTKAEGGTGPAGGHRKDSTSSVASSTTGTNSTTNRSRPYQSRFQTGKSTEKPAEPAKEEDEDEEDESESESSEEEEEESDDSPPPPSPPKKTTVLEPKSRMEKTDIGPLLARSANARDTPATSNTNTSPSTTLLYAARKRAGEPPPTTHVAPPSSALSSYRSRSRISSPTTRESEPEPTTTRRYGTSSTSAGSSGIGSSRYPSSYSAADYTPSTGLSRSSTGTALYSPPADDTPSSRYSSGLASKYLNRSRHNFDVDDHPTPSSRYGSSTTTPTTSSTPMTRRSYLSKKRNGGEPDNKSSRLQSLRDRRAKINRSKKKKN